MMAFVAAGDNDKWWKVKMVFMVKLGFKIQCWWFQPTLVNLIQPAEINWWLQIMMAYVMVRWQESYDC